MRSLGAWKTARELARLRNRIAHNPVYFTWNGPQTEQEPDFIGIAEIKSIDITTGGTPISKTSIGKSTNDVIALIKKLEFFRKQWCEKRDVGSVPRLKI